MNDQNAEVREAILEEIADRLRFITGCDLVEDYYPILADLFDETSTEVLATVDDEELEEMYGGFMFDDILIE